MARIGEISPSAHRLNEARKDLREAIDQEPLLKPHGEKFYKAIEELIKATIDFRTGGKY